MNKVKNCLNCNKEFSRKTGHRGNKYCCQQCQLDFQYKEYIDRWKQGLEDGMVGSLSISGHIKRYLFNKYNHKCSRCYWNEENPYTNKIPLEVEHIDGNYKNNKEENLTLLCPNCHSLTPTYKALNKGKGRKNRK